ncbi:unnamed protein product [Phytophthora fragariaefolia]|uniref:Unnamed protein product n=1 Tax=Phytophthora fragariaefolia TaxID=1490495 RepID=A0A9W7CV24_9STRA|nr:unnamed protein product [Phytophthora fragariaefolia]
MSWIQTGVQTGILFSHSSLTLTAIPSPLDTDRASLRAEPSLPQVHGTAVAANIPARGGALNTLTCSGEAVSLSDVVVMPTLSRKRKVLSTIRNLWRSALERQLENEEGSSSADEEQEEIEALYFVLKSKRYITQRRRVPRPPSRIQHYLTGMPNTEFKLHFRLSRQFFTAVCSLIADPEVFKNVTGKQNKMNVVLHLMGLLRTLCSADGEGRSAYFLSVGGHTPEDILAKRTVQVLNSLRSKVIMWPGEDERQEISQRIKNASTLPQSSMILHNMAIADPMPPKWIEPEPGTGDDADEDDDPLIHDSITGAERRDYLADLVFHRRY